VNPELARLEVMKALDGKMDTLAARVAALEHRLDGLAGVVAEHGSGLEAAKDLPVRVAALETFEDTADAKLADTGQQLDDQARRLNLQANEVGQLGERIAALEKKPRGK
jgi:hypothetical protein